MFSRCHGGIGLFVPALKLFVAAAGCCVFCENGNSEGLALIYSANIYTHLLICTNGAMRSGSITPIHRGESAYMRSRYAKLSRPPDLCMMFTPCLHLMAHFACGHLSFVYRAAEVASKNFRKDRMEMCCSYPHREYEAENPSCPTGTPAK